MSKEYSYDSVCHSYNKAMKVLSKLGKEYFHSYMEDVPIDIVNSKTVQMRGSLRTLIMIAGDIHRQFLMKGIGYEEMKLSSYKNLSSLTLIVNNSELNQCQILIDSKTQNDEEIQNPSRQPRHQSDSCTCNTDTFGRQDT